MGSCLKKTLWLFLTQAHRQRTVLLNFHVQHNENNLQSSETEFEDRFHGVVILKNLNFVLNMWDFSNRCKAFMNVGVFVTSAAGAALLQLYLCDFSILFS